MKKKHRSGNCTGTADPGKCGIHDRQQQHRFPDMGKCKSGQR